MAPTTSPAVSTRRLGMERPASRNAWATRASCFAIARTSPAVGGLRGSGSRSGPAPPPPAGRGPRLLRQGRVAAADRPRCSPARLRSPGRRPGHALLSVDDAFDRRPRAVGVGLEQLDVGRESEALGPSPGVGDEGLQQPFGRLERRFTTPEPRRPLLRGGELALMLVRMSRRIASGAPDSVTGICASRWAHWTSDMPMRISVRLTIDWSPEIAKRSPALAGWIGPRGVPCRSSCPGRGRGRSRRRAAPRRRRAPPRCSRRRVVGRGRGGGARPGSARRVTSRSLPNPGVPRS